MKKTSFPLSCMLIFLMISACKEDPKSSLKKMMLPEGMRGDKSEFKHPNNGNKHIVQNGKYDGDADLPDIYKEVASNSSVGRPLVTDTYNGVDIGIIELTDKHLSGPLQRRSPVYSFLTPSQHDAWP